MTPSELTTLRRQLGYYQYELAALLGVSPQTVKSWERGYFRIREPYVKLLQTIKRKETEL